MTKTELRDPQDLRIHRLHKQHIPAPDKSSIEWLSFVDAQSAAGPHGIPPIVVNESGEIMEGVRRWLAAKQLGWDEIRCDVRADGDAATIIVDALFGQRDMTRGAKVYIALGLLKDFIESAEKRRLANLKHGRKTLEKPLKLPNQSYFDSEMSVAELCQRWGVSWETLKRARQVRDIFEKNPDIKAEWEPKLLSGDKNLWNVLSAVGGAGANQSGRDDGVAQAQMEFWDSPFSQLAHAAPAWKKLDDERRAGVLEDFRKAAKKLPEDLREGMKEILDELS